MPQIVEDNGVHHVFPDDATHEEMQKALDEVAPLREFSTSPIISSETPIKSIISGGPSPTPQPPADDTSKFIAKPQEQPGLDEINAANPSSEPGVPTGSAIGDLKALANFSPLDAIPEAAQYLPSDETAGAIMRGINPVAWLLPDETVNQLAGATADTLEGAARFPTTVLGTATGALGAAGGLASKLVGAGFAAEGLKSIPDDIAAIGNANGVRDTASAVEGLLAHTLMVGGIAHPVLSREIAATPAQKAVGDLLQQGHSLDDIEKAVDEHRKVTTVTTTGEPETPEQEARRMLANIQPRQEQPIIGNKTQPLTPGPEQLGRIQHLESKVISALGEAGEEYPESVLASIHQGHDLSPDAYEIGLQRMLDSVGKNKTQQRLRNMKQRSGEAGSIPLPSLSPETIATLKEHGLAIKGMIQDIRNAQQVSDLDRATMGRSGKLQQSFQEAQAVEDEIRRVAPKQATQNAISAYREANGDMATLKDWETNAKQKWMKDMARDAQKLTPEQREAAKLANEKYAEAGARGQAAGVLDDLRDAYVQHQWQLGNFRSGAGGRGLATSARFQKARTFNTFFEGDQAGFKPKELAIGKLLPSYLDELNRVIANREFIADIAKGKSNAGTPLVSPSGRITSAESAVGDSSLLANPHAIQWVQDPKTGEMMPPTGYKVMPEQPSLRKWKWAAKTEDGTPIFMNADLALHPEAYDRLNAMVGESGLRKYAKGDATTNAGKLARSAVTVADAVSSEIKKSMFGIGAPFHQVQEGTHAVGHGVAPWGHEPIDLQNNPAQMSAVTEGGLMLMPERFSGTGYEEGISGKDALVMKGIGQLGAPGRAVQRLGEQYQNYLFHDYIPRLKYATYQAALERNMNRFAPEIAKGDMTEGDVKMLTGSQVNAAYGHLNYALLDRSPNIQHALQLGLLAPDFLEARSRFVGQALKAFTGSKAGQEQLWAVAKLALYQAAAAYTATKLGGGQYDPTRPFEAVIGDRRYTMRSVPEDLMRAFSPTDARAFWSARASVPMSTFEQIRSGLNYRGEKSTATEALGDMLANTVPLLARQLPGVSGLRHLVSPASRNEPVSPLEQLAGSAGVKISRSSPIQHGYEMARKWKNANGIEGDKSTYPISKYQQLRYALEDGSSKAGDEYEKLVAKEGRAKVKSGFAQALSHPWTGSLANDKKFKDSLTPDDRELLSLADERRKEIQRRFNELH